MLVGKGIWEQFIAEGMVDAARRERSSKFVNVIFVPQKKSTNIFFDIKLIIIFAMSL